MFDRADRAPAVAARRGAIRRITTVTVLITSAALLSACSAASEGSESESKTLTVWHYLTTDGELAYIDAFADDFEASHPGVTVENVYVPYDQIVSKTVAAAGTESGPDIIEFNGPDTGTLASAGALAPLDTYWDGYADSDQFPDSVVHSNEGKIYSIQGLVNLLGLWYNKDILDELGVEPPTTIDELEASMAKAAAAGYAGITLSALPNPQGAFQAYPWITGAGFDFADPDAGDLEDAYSRVRGWIDDGYLAGEAVTWDQTVPFQVFAAGGVAFAENGNWQIGTAQSDAKFTYGVAPLPVGPDGKVYLGGETAAIGAFSANPDLAWEYLQESFLSSDGELLALEKSGALPARADAAEDPAVTGNELLASFAGIIADSGANYPDSSMPADSVSDIMLAAGQAWSSALGGTASPSDAATKLVDTLGPLMSK